MASESGKSSMEILKITLNSWIRGKVKEFAKKNDMSERAAIRFIINQFFKGKII